MLDVLSDETRAMLTLKLVSGVGARLTAALLERFGSAQSILCADAHLLQEVPHVGDKLANAIASAQSTIDVDAEIQRINQHQAQLAVLGASAYPEPLSQIPDPPHLLYVRGELREEDQQAVAVIGSRTCTSYGLRVATSLAGNLARAGFTVVSGLARGIDAAAHKGALAASGRTIAVLAGGLGRLYPPEHKPLAEAISKSGAVVSENPISQEPMAGLFPPRNRIISGLSQAVIIVEAGEKSGALITATQAGEQGRTVFAIPGAVDSKPSAGTNALIRQGAILCRGVGDVLEELQGVSARVNAETAARAAAAQQRQPPPKLDTDEKRIWDLLSGGAIHLDEMVQRLNVSVAVLSTKLMMLEMKKIVRRLPGNRYERC